MSRFVLASTVLLLCIIVFFYFLTKFVQPRLRRSYKWKTNLLVGAVYLALLILSIPLVILLEQSEFFIFQNAQVQGLLTEAPEGWSEDYEKTYEVQGEPSRDKDQLLMNSHQSFETKVTRLEIREVSNYGPVFLERKNSADGIVEVSTYVAPHYAGLNTSQAIDYTKMVPPPKITLVGGTLNIEQPTKLNLVLKYFDDNFTVIQFKGGERNFQGGGIRSGAKKILIRIPSDMEVSDGNSKILNWVGDSSP